MMCVWRWRIIDVIFKSMSVFILKKVLSTNQYIHYFLIVWRLLYCIRNVHQNRFLLDYENFQNVLCLLFLNALMI